MSKNSKVYQKIKSGLDSGIFKTLRLVNFDKDENPEILIPYSKLETKECYSRLEMIKFKVENGELPPGNYAIQCRSNWLKSGIVETFPLSIQERKMIPFKIPNKDETIEEPEVMISNQVDFEDYVDLIKENAKLKADLQFANLQLKMQADFYKDMLKQQPQALNDSAKEKTTGERIFESIEAIAPSLMGLAEKMLDQRDKQITLEEKKLDKVVVKKKGDMAKQKMDNLIKRLETLYEQDPERFDAEMDDLEQRNPEAYEYACKVLEIEDEDEEEEEFEELEEEDE